MSTNKTQHYQLHSWEAEDDFLRSEFNENFAAIDTALNGKVGIVTGSYTGDGAASRTISLGFTPKAVLIFRQDGRTGESSDYIGGLALAGQPAHYAWLQKNIFEIVSNGFKLSFYSSSNYTVGANQSGKIYFYLAVK